MTIRCIRLTAVINTAGTLLREARRRAVMTQAELAQRAGITQSVISAYESHRREPSLATRAAQRRARSASATSRVCSTVLVLTEPARQRE